MLACAIIPGMSASYPISLLVNKLSVLIVGGGEVATRKLQGLLDCDARVTLIAPEVTQTIYELADKQLCSWIEKAYDPSDLDGIQLVFACTNDEATNRSVSEDATARGLLVNVADCPELCTFYLPSVLRRGKLSVAVSTEGSSPFTAAQIRRKLEDQFDDAIEVYLELLQSWRTKILHTLDEEKRLLFWRKASEGSIYELVEQGQAEQADLLLTAVYDDLRNE